MDEINEPDDYCSVHNSLWTMFLAPTHYINQILQHGSIIHKLPFHRPQDRPCFRVYAPHAPRCPIECNVFLLMSIVFKVVLLQPHGFSYKIRRCIPSRRCVRFFFLQKLWAIKIGLPLTLWTIKNVLRFKCTIHVHTITQNTLHPMAGFQKYYKHYFCVSVNLRGDFFLKFIEQSVNSANWLHAHHHNDRHYIFKCASNGLHVCIMRHTVRDSICKIHYELQVFLFSVFGICVSFFFQPEGHQVG